MSGILGKTVCWYFCVSACLFVCLSVCFFRGNKIIGCLHGTPRAVQGHWRFSHLQGPPAMGSAGVHHGYDASGPSLT